MNFAPKSLLISAFLLASMSALADLPTMEVSGLNPLDKKTGFIDNHFIALSEVKVGEGTKKFIAFIPSIGSDEVIVYEVDKSTNSLTESTRFTKHLHSPFYLTFDPSGLTLYGVSSTSNFISQHTFDPVSQKYVSSETKKNTNLLNAGFKTECDNNNFFSFDYSRTLQFFSGKHLAYVTCGDKNGEPNVVQYQFDPKTGLVKTPNSAISHEDIYPSEFKIPVL